MFKTAGAPVRLNRKHRWLWFPAFAGTTIWRISRRKLLRQHEHLARTRYPGPVAVEVGHQPFDLHATGRPFQRGLVGELIARDMHRGIADAPASPRLLRTERLHGVGQMLLAVPVVECRAF